MQEENELLKQPINWSFTKRRKIKKLSKKLKVEKDDIPMNVQDLFASGNKREEHEKKLYDMCEADSEISEVMNKYNINRTDLEDIMTKISGWGGGRVIKEIYLPAAALLNPPTLEYLIIEINKIDKIEDGNKYEQTSMNLIMELLEYFGKNL